LTKDKSYWDNIWNDLLSLVLSVIRRLFLAGLKSEGKILNELLRRDEWKRFQFLEHQLEVLDRKASTIVSLDGLLLALTASFLAIKTPHLAIGLAFAASSSLVLFSALVGAFKVLWTKWATIIMAKSSDVEKGLDELIAFRDEKTTYLHCSIILMLMALIGYTISIWLYVLIEVF